MEWGFHHMMESPSTREWVFPFPSGNQTWVREWCLSHSHSLTQILASKQDLNAFPGATSEFWRTKNPKIQRRLFWVRQSWLFGVGLEEEKTCWASFNWQAAPHRRTKMSCTTSLSSYCTYNTMPCICQTFKALSCFPYSASFFLTFPFFISLQLTRALPWISKPA